MISPHLAVTWFQQLQQALLDNAPQHELLAIASRGNVEREQLLRALMDCEGKIDGLRECISDLELKIRELL